VERRFLRHRWNRRSNRCKAGRGRRRQQATAIDAQRARRTAFDRRSSVNAS
jgi:hypothetical protein